MGMIEIKLNKIKKFRVELCPQPDSCGTGILIWKVVGERFKVQNQDIEMEVYGYFYLESLANEWCAYLNDKQLGETIALIPTHELMKFGAWPIESDDPIEVAAK